MDNFKFIGLIRGILVFIFGLMIMLGVLILLPYIAPILANWDGGEVISQPTYHFVKI